MTVLKLVPWGDVIKSAPVVAEGAKKLWDTVGKDKTAAAQTPQRIDQAPLADGSNARLAAAEAEIATLHEQMQASSALIKALADQNAELVQRVESNRRRLLWLVAGVAVFAAIAGLNLAVTLSG
jgi:2-C-methyl-D-erythritol 4-phosphate cytidylyltransferase